MASKGKGKAKGFGKPAATTQNERIEQARKLLLDFGKHHAKVEGQKKKVRQFLQDHLDKLDESLLDVLPLAFDRCTAHQPEDRQRAFASLFAVFGDALQEFPLGDRALNLELSIATYQQALKICTREAFQKDWAAMQNSLGIAYSDRIRGERAENLERAIAAYELALQVYTPQAFPEYWALTQNNLGEAYRNRIRGERAENLERAIAAHESALQIRTREAFPQGWADAQICLGSAYSARIREERAENLERAIAAYELALQVYTRESFPEDWAMTQNNLGNAYSDRIRGERAENLERAIAAYELALQVRTQKDFPEYWADTQNNLVNAYSDRIRGERAENLERAIAAHELALQIYTREDFPEKWAVGQHNLATAYRERIRGERAENLERAISSYNLAAEVFTRDAYPVRWSIVRGNLADALTKRAALTDDAADLDTAVTLFQEALEKAPAGSPDFIDSQYRLGNTLARRYDRTREPDDLEGAVRAYRIALDAIDPEHYDRQQIWEALPAAQSILGSRFVREGRGQEGLQLLVSSIDQLDTGNGEPGAYASVLFEIGYAHQTLGNWYDAQTYYRDAFRIYEDLQDRPGTAKSRAAWGEALASRGYLEKGLGILAIAREEYRSLERPDEAEKVDRLYQIFKQAMERPKEV